jgi:hypothetical protein
MKENATLPSETPKQPCATCVARKCDYMSEIRQQATLGTFHHHLYLGRDFLCHETHAEPCVAWVKFGAARERRPSYQLPTLDEVRLSLGEVTP